LAIIVATIPSSSFAFAPGGHGSSPSGGCFSAPTSLKTAASIDDTKATKPTNPDERTFHDL
jgi:hypothetical protein